MEHLENILGAERLWTAFFSWETSLPPRLEELGFLYGPMATHAFQFIQYSELLETITFVLVCLSSLHRPLVLRELG